MKWNDGKRWMQLKTRTLKKRKFRITIEETKAKYTKHKSVGGRRELINMFQIDSHAEKKFH